MTMSIITRLIGDKRRWRHYKARTRRLPSSYRTTVEALERYLMCFGPGDGGSAASMFEDLADLFEQSAASGTPVRAIVGEDPVEFAEAFLRNYPEGSWISRERVRLTDAVDRAAEGTGPDAGPDAGPGTDGLSR
jgi:DNA-binding ferritin-like protein (Dps family)